MPWSAPARRLAPRCSTLSERPARRRMGPRARPARRTWALITLALVVSLGCGGRRLGLLLPDFRFIEQDPEALFAREDLTESKSVFEWVFHDEASLDSWQLNVDRSELSVSSRGLRIPLGGRHVTLTRSVTLEADEIDAVLVRVKGLAHNAVELKWTGPDQGTAASRTIRAELGTDAENGFRAFHLVTRGHPQWTGTISSVTLAFTVPKDKTVVVGSVRGIAESVVQEAVEAALSHSWKVALGDEVRNAILAMPGSPLGRRLTVPEDAWLRFGFGGQPYGTAKLTFRVTAVRSDGSRVELFGAPAPEPGRWRDEAVALTPLGGETVDLELLVECAGDFDARHGLPAWSNVEVVSPHRQNRPNVILVSIDTLRSDRLSLYGHSRLTSPALDAWAADAVVFEQAVAASPWTLPSHVSIFTGIDAHRHGVNFDTPAPPRLVTLAELMRAAGYATLAVTGGGFVHPQYGLAQGFDSYRSFSARVGGEDELEVGIEGALNLVGRYRDRPFLLFFHTYEVHNPYQPRMPYFSRFTGLSEGPMVGVKQMPEEAEDGFLDDGRRLTVVRKGEPERLLAIDEIDLALALYDAGIAYTDAAIGRLLQHLKDLGLDRRTVVVVTSDHGEMFGEHGLFNHVCLYDENLKVPLVIRDPNRRRAGHRISEQVRSIDVLPTLLDLTGIEPPPGIDGVSLVPLMEGRALPEAAGLAWSYAPSTNFGISLRERNRLKLISRNDPWRFPASAQALFNLESDAAEEHPLTGPQPALKRLSRMTNRVLAEDIPGVRVRIASSRAGRAYRGAIRSPLSPVHRLKTLNVGCACVTYESDGTAMLEVAPGDDVTLWLEGVTAGDLTIRLEPDGVARDPIELAVDLSTLDRGVRQIVPTPTGWAIGEGDAPVEDGISVWWHLRPQGWPGAPPEIDESLRGQLEALGYAE